mmetsp:Transcript_11191/g.22029  ORF Transcript_11191/g.22029 Transcript_11191/m.22029 type:complete len:307 (+) Transcript_11191:1332-2252(+)
MPKRRHVREDSPSRKRQFLGRVANRSKVKRVELMALGELVERPGWHNCGYIFPRGYLARIDYKSIDEPSMKADYLCSILDQGAKPLFQVTEEATQRVFSGKSPTACWKQILDCINATIAARGLPTVKTQVAGPEYFGLNDPQIVASIESLDPGHVCCHYWAEKEVLIQKRAMYEKSHPRVDGVKRKRRSSCSESDCDYSNESSFRDVYSGAWSVIDRHERYKKRSNGIVNQDDNPLPEYNDPITLQPIVSPAVSPYGHVAGYHTWVQALKETQGVCPFTKLPLTTERLTKLTMRNFCLYSSQLILS